MGLFTDGVKYRADLAVETHFRVVVADRADHVAHDVFKLNVAAGGHFAGHHDHTGLDHGLYRHTTMGIFGQDRIEDGV